MKILCAALMLCQAETTFELPGVLELVDRPPSATPVEALSFRLHPLQGGIDLTAYPDPTGKFTIKNVRPGRYALIFPMPGRMLAPENFELSLTGAEPLKVVVSMKSADLAVTARRFPTAQNQVAAMLCPDDPHLTLRESCYLNQVSGPATTFRFVPSGRYRLFLFDAQFQQDVAKYAPRSADFLKNQASSVEVSGSGQTEAVATYIDSETIQQAIRLARLP